MSTAHNSPRTAVYTLLILLGFLLTLGISGCGDDYLNDNDLPDGDTTPGDGDTPDGDADGDIDADIDDDGETDGDVTPDGDVDGDVDGDGDSESDIEVEPLPFAPAGPEAAPDPMADGPFPVGVITITYYDQTRINPDTNQPRRLKTEIWYPAVQSAANEEGFVYDLRDEAEGEDLGEYTDIVKTREMPTLPTDAVRDAAVDRSHGPYPLIVFSHGSNGIRFQSTFYTPHLASHGYIVISPDHEGNTLWDIIRDGWDSMSVAASAPKRLEDIPFLLDRMEEKNADPEDLLYGMIDLENIGVSGHSFGGFTSIGSACLDDRIDIAVPQSPVVSLVEVFGCDMDNYPAPIMVMGGTRDNTLEWFDQYCDTISLKAPKKFLYELERAGHFTFSDMCTLDLMTLAEDLDFGDAANALNDGCSETDNIPYKDAHKSINYYATAFINYYLRGSVGSMDYLIELSEFPFTEVNFYEDDEIPDWPEGLGCFPDQCVASDTCASLTCLGGDTIYCIDDCERRGEIHETCDPGCTCTNDTDPPSCGNCPVDGDVDGDADAEIDGDDEVEAELEVDGDEELEAETEAEVETAL